MTQLIEADIDQLTSIHEIGQKIAISIKEFFSDNENLEIINRLKSSGLTIERYKLSRSVTGNLLEGEGYCHLRAFYKIFT